MEIGMRRSIALLLIYLSATSSSSAAAAAIDQPATAIKAAQVSNPAEMPVSYTEQIIALVKILQPSGTSQASGIPSPNAKKPDLQPHQPDGWDDILVISNVTGTSTSTPIYDNDTIYLDTACINSGRADAGRFYLDLYIDDVFTVYWDVYDGLETNTYVYDIDVDLGSLSVGSHTLKLVCDGDNEVSETNENNNEYTRIITVLPSGGTQPDLEPYQLPDWDDVLVISTVTGTTTSAATFNNTENIYVDFSCGNFGTAAAAAFKYGVYLDGSLEWYVDQTDGLDVDFGSYALDADLGVLSTGLHTIEVRCDYDDQVAEPNEVNNNYSRIIDVQSVGGPQADLEPNQLPGWDDVLVISDVNETNTGASYFDTETNVYVDFSCHNIGTAAAGAFKYGVFLDGSLQWYVDQTGGLAVDFGSYALDADLGTLSFGWHTIEVRCDYDNQISEPNELNNNYSRDIYVEPIPSDISGYKFSDPNGNGTWDLPDEAGLAGWQIYLDNNLNGFFDPNDPNTITDSNGFYIFEDMLPGTYRVAEVNQPGWIQTYPGYVVPASASYRVQRPVITTTGSTVPIYKQGEIVNSAIEQITQMTLESSSLINIDDFRTAFPGVDGSGYSVVILDTGADMDHSFFGVDLDSNGVADRIVYQYDFADGDTSAEAVESHGCNVAGIVGSSDSTYTGMAPGCNLIILKVFTDAGDGDFGYVESALQWIDTNVSTYNIVSVNMSLGDSENHTSPINLYGIDDELVALAAQDVIVASSSGNDFHTFGSAQGIGYPAADPYSLSVGAVYDADIGGVSYSSGAQAYTTGADRVCPFSQRHSDLAMSSIFAPGAEITNAGLNNGTVTMHGTSQSSPHIAGIAALAQDLAGSRLGRRLTPAEFTGIIQSSAVDIIDGDDEDDNVTNTGLTFPRVDVMAMAQAITAMAVSGIHIVELSSGVDAENINFGNQPSCGAWGYYPADIDSDCYVNISDLQILGDNWIDGPIGDIDENAVVDMNDFVQLSTQWLLCTDPADPNCSVPLH